MKNFKKILLPITSAAAVCAIVAPVITSCSNKALASISWVKTDTTQTYISQITPKEGSIAENQLTNEYFQDIKNRPLIFCDDWMIEYTDSLYGFNKVSCNINKIDTTEHRIDFSFSALGETNGNSVSVNLTYTNMPIIIDYFEAIPEGFIRSLPAFNNEEDITNDVKWELKGTILNGGVKEFDGAYKADTYKTASVETKTQINSLFYMLFFESNYFKNIEVIQQA